MRRFSHAKTGLVVRPLPTFYQPRSTLPATVELKRNSPGSKLEGFVICGEDQKWFWADAMIDGQSVVVWSPQVTEEGGPRSGGDRRAVSSRG